MINRAAAAGSPTPVAAMGVEEFVRAQHGKGGFAKRFSIQKNKILFLFEVTVARINAF
jgi:hypothetical protein